MRWLSVWTVDLAQPRAEFWFVTPREFRASVDRAHERERRMDGRFGVVASIIANVNRDSKQRPSPYRPSDFFTSLADAPVAASSGPSDEAIMAGLMGWAALCGSKLN